MPSLPLDIIAVLLPFSELFSAPVWNHVRLMVTGAILCQGPRTVTSILRTMGHAKERRFEKYHHVLSRAKWSGLQGARILFGLLVTLLPPGAPVIIVVDDTIERRNGKKISGLGIWRDPVRSTEKKVVTCFGLRWVAMMLLVRLPWSKRPWALPFLTVMATSEKADAKKKRRHKTLIDRVMIMVRLVSRWCQRPWFLVGDGAFACVSLGWACKKAGGALISRLRLDTRLYDFPEPVPPGKRGRKPSKGERLPTLQKLAGDPAQKWREIIVDWYGGCPKLLEVLDGFCLWHTPGQPPLAIRWVLVRDPEKKGEKPFALFSTAHGLTAWQIIARFVMRWSIEVTFEESRRHLGVESQRQWSDKAIARTTPALLALFSIVCLMAIQILKSTSLALVRQSAWYVKQEATFSDILASVRRIIWSHQYFVNSAPKADFVQLPAEAWEALMYQLTATA